MPLDKECSVPAFKGNIKQSIKDDKPQKQAVAIAFSTLKKACGVTSKKRMTPDEIVMKKESEIFDRLDRLYEEFV